MRVASPALAAIQCLLLPCASLLLLWGCSTAAVRRFNSYAGPFQIHFKEALQCPDGSIASGKLLVNLTGTLQYSRAFSGMVYNGLVQLARDVNPGDVGVKLHIAKWDNVAGWRDNFFRMDGGEYCVVMATIGKDPISEINRNNPLFPRTCPLLGGTYLIRNLSTSLLSRYEHFPVFPYGRFRGDLIFYYLQSKDINGCFRGVAEVVPKVKS